MKPWLFCFDMDGTILNGDSELSIPTQEALLTLRQQGHKVAFVTGRTGIDMKETYLPHADYVLLNSGSKLLDTHSQQILFYDKIPASVARALASQCLAREWLLYLIYDNIYFVTRITNGVLEFAAEIGKAPCLLTEINQLPMQDVDCFMASCDREEIANEILRQHLSLRCLPSAPGCCDIVCAQGGKWAGICRLATLLEIPPSRILAMGNYDNDIDMIQGARLGIAVANASAKAKAAADYVTASDHNRNALCEVLSHFSSTEPFLT